MTPYASNIKFILLGHDRSGSGLHDVVDLEWVSLGASETRLFSSQENGPNLGILGLNSIKILIL